MAAHPHGGTSEKYGVASGEFMVLPIRPINCNAWPHPFIQGGWELRYSDLPAAEAEFHRREEELRRGPVTDLEPSHA